MSITFVDPVSRAIERTKQVLFRPFDLGKWLILGFCAFLEQLGEGGGGGGGGGGGPGGGGGGPGGGGGGGGEGPNPDEFRRWVSDHLDVILLVGGLILLVIILLAVVFTWLGSRGKFMFLDGIVRNRAAVVEPWREFRGEGNSLFCFRLVFGLATFAVTLLIAGVGVAIAWEDIQAGAFRASALAAVLVGGLLLFVLLVVAGVINLFLRDFVAPIMYLRRVPVLAAWRVFRQELLAGRAGIFVLYVLFRIVIGVVEGLLAGVATCLTCCLAAVPYLGSVILLPLLVFDRSYPLCFLEQFGPEWRFFERAPLATEGAEDLPPDEEPPDERQPPDERITPG
jgi:hypothetical protein